MNPLKSAWKKILMIVPICRFTTIATIASNTTAQRNALMHFKDLF